MAFGKCFTPAGRIGQCSLEVFFYWSRGVADFPWIGLLSTDGHEKKPEFVKSSHVEGCCSCWFGRSYRSRYFCRDRCCRGRFWSCFYSRFDRGGNDRLFQCAELCPVGFCLSAFWWEDRKSTRLNSS